MDKKEGSVDGSCHYKVLGIRKDASHSDIRQAYLKLALKWHPDRMKKNPSLTGDAKQMFQRIHEAYSVLSDEKKRSEYDGTINQLIDDEWGKGMEEFMHDLFKMMDNDNKPSVPGEEVGEGSLEDLHVSFMEIFGAELTSFIDVEDNHNHHHHHSKSHSKSSKPRTAPTTPYARPTPKRTNSASNSNSNSSTAKC